MPRASQSGPCTLSSTSRAVRQQYSSTHLPAGWQTGTRAWRTAGAARLLTVSDSGMDVVVSFPQQAITCTEEVSMPRVVSDGVAIHYRLEGDGSPLVLQHGFTD